MQSLNKECTEHATIDKIATDEISRGSGARPPFPPLRAGPPGTWPALVGPRRGTPTSVSLIIIRIHKCVHIYIYIYILRYCVIYMYVKVKAATLASEARARAWQAGCPSSAPPALPNRG